MVMPPSKPFPGPFSYNLSPYWREPVDNVMSESPVTRTTIMTVNQIGKTDAIINAWLGYSISENPGPMQYLTGHEKGNDEAMRRIDEMFDSCGLRDRGLIKSQEKRARKTKSGDTDTRKDFLHGFLVMGTLTNVKSDARQFTIKIQVRDDMDAAPIETKSGKTLEVFDTRTDAYGSRRKILNISTAEVSGLSNIEICWSRSDQRYWNVPCPKCGKLIVLEWEVDMGKARAGLYWKLNAVGQLDEKSVEYVCQKCGEGFKETEKYEMNQAGIWVPTVENPKEAFHRGYTLNALNPVGMRNWPTLINHYLKAYPPNEPKDEGVEQTFYNLVLAKPYVKSSDEMSATNLQVHNKRPYSPGVVPEDMSIADGNGGIVMLTCAIDLNGIFGRQEREDDVRLDWEVLAHSESGATYSVKHGSIGTFIYRETLEQKAVFREKWTYDHTKPNNVWPVLDAILTQDWVVSGSSGRKMKILFTVLDTGNWEKVAFEYVDSRKFQFQIVGVKGTSENKGKSLNRESKNFKESAARPGSLYIVDGHSIKDNLSALMRMKWNKGTGQGQPAGFMNYPIDDEGKLYQYENFFAHYEAEHKVPTKDSRGIETGFAWKKKSTSHENHALDLRVYNMAAAEIFVHLYLQELKRSNPEQWREVKYMSWKDFVLAVA